MRRAATGGVWTCTLIPLYRVLIPRPCPLVSCLIHAIMSISHKRERRGRTQGAQTQRAMSYGTYVSNAPHVPPPSHPSAYSDPAGRPSCGGTGACRAPSRWQQLRSRSSSREHTVVGVRQWPTSQRHDWAPNASAPHMQRRRPSPRQPVTDSKTHRLCACARAYVVHASLSAHTSASPPDHRRRRARPPPAERQGCGLGQRAHPDHARHPGTRRIGRRHASACRPAQSATSVPRAGRSARHGLHRRHAADHLDLPLHRAAVEGVATP